LLLQTTGGVGCAICPRNGTRLGFNTAATTDCTCAKGYYWSTNLCIKCADVASTNAAGKLANTECGCPVDTFSSTDTPEGTGCQSCPVNSYRKLVTTVVGESVDLKTTGIVACTCNPNYWWSTSNNICVR
jgi:hypothetical protein